MFIDLGGVDGAGKTTIARLLSKETGAVCYATPPKKLAGYRNKIDAEASPLEHYKFYLEGVRIASKEIWEMLAEGQNVICDRYWLTTYVYHKVMGVAVETINLFLSCLLFNDVLIFSNIFILSKIYQQALVFQNLTRYHRESRDWSSTLPQDSYSDY